MTSATSPHQTVEKLEQSIEETLVQYNSSFNIATIKDDALGPSAYNSRLATFRTETYFAKPLCLSPLICAAFG
jgi:hypothetical protein